jgi:cytosine/adenosine deaminase-related metal-dependent hydrolase
MLLTADRIHDGSGWLPGGAVLELSPDGTILAVHAHPQQDVRTQAFVHKGWLCPGFVNVHGHLELAHMQAVLPQGAGLIPFLQGVTRHRNDFTEAQKTSARRQAYEAMLQAGIVAAGDIANTTDSLELRARGGLHLHTFIECIGFTQTHAAARLAFSQNMLQAYASQQLPEGVYLNQSIVPHAPYSVSEALFTAIDHAAPEALISIHNQETAGEDAFYQSKTGPVPDLLAGLGIDDAFFSPSGRSSLQTYGQWLQAGHPLILVHNTCTEAADVRFAQQRFERLYWCLCPNANLYIENRLPDVPMLLEEGAFICIGTDSLASNHKLCILSELQSLRTYFPQLSWEALLRWATLHGAVALQMEGIVGRLEAGRKPGILLLQTEGDEAVSVKRLV